MRLFAFDLQKVGVLQFELAVTEQNEFVQQISYALIRATRSYDSSNPGLPLTGMHKW